MSRLILLALLPLAAAAPALAQTPDPHAHHAQPVPAADPHAGHAMPQASPPADPHAGHRISAPADPHAGHAMPQASPPADPHAGHRMPAPALADPHAGHAMAAPQTGADLPVGSEPAPPVARDNAADRIFGAAAMDRGRAILAGEHGGARLSKVMLNLSEALLGSDGGYHWDAEAWYGGDLNRLVLKSEGEGSWDHGVDDAEVQALYSRAVGVYTDLQLGVRHDFEPGPQRTYATVGFETLLPYWFEAEGALFLSNKGELLGRLEGTYDLRLAQRLVLQPRAEVNFAAEDIPTRAVGSGVSDAELGLRLRYEIKREFAPYVGVVWSRKFGDTADFARAEGEDVEDTRFVAGLRAWF
ncbi:MAG: copper resistance protein CopB [Phenylobacterium sp. RIFCSPHIGHO2_01_FULL_69_31]|uniref:copper resistance protein B n=1 Tax=Phenylobacterium sp. RIFCSPHIGHO2_01_FULL_69_31 TaxID=1801944 RepID=UPI0008D4CF6C|nr:copper resistance protein B [Phenylobacterium sp. RIFCSPHIGHO2_01_FULL_69_31]OHB26428.1 MAG: copper resistance protein CopB [Phenylobacterium sp. RIFCSPHIGHO2_01_FULL_69_31]